MNAGERPTVPMTQHSSTRIFQISCAILTRSGCFFPEAERYSSKARSIFRVVRLLALRAVRGIPAAKGMPSGTRPDRSAGRGVGRGTGSPTRPPSRTWRGAPRVAVLVKARLRSVSSRPRRCRFFPLLLDHLADLRERMNWPPRSSTRCASGLAVRPNAIALAVFLGQADLVQERVGLLQIQDRPLLPVLLPGLMVTSSAGAVEPAVPMPSQNASLSWSRSMPSERAA